MENLHITIITQAMTAKGMITNNGNSFVEPNPAVFEREPFVTVSLENSFTSVGTSDRALEAVEEIGVGSESERDELCVNDSRQRHPLEMSSGRKGARKFGRGTGVRLGFGVGRER